MANQENENNKTETNGVNNENTNTSGEDTKKGDGDASSENTSNDSVKGDSPEEIEKKIKEAVEIEKRKLYDSLGATKKEAKEALEKLEKYEKEKQDLENQKKEAEEKKRKELEAQERDKMDLKERLAQLEESLQNKDSQLQMTLEKQKETFQEELKKRDLELKREQILSQHKGEIVPDLVRGNSVEELEKSVEQAKNRYQEIYEQAKKSLEESSINNGKLPTSSGQNKVPNTEGNPAGSGGNTDGAKSYEEIAAMSPEEFKKYKDKVLAEKGL